MLMFAGLGLLTMVGGAWIGASRLGDRFVCFGLGVMIAASVVQVSVAGLGQTVERAPSAQIEAVEIDTRAGVGLSVFFIVLDTYASGAVLSERFDYNLSSFKNALADRGFTIPQRSFSNYPWTSLSMSSAVDQRYVTTASDDQRSYNSLESARTISDDNAALRRFRAKGYTYAMFDPGRYTTTLSCTNAVDYCLQCGGILSEGEILLLGRTPLTQLMKRFVPSLYLEAYGQCPLSNLRQEAAKIPTQPVYLLAHHMAMHDSMHVDRRCETLTEPYPNSWASPGSKYAKWQLDCINRQVIDLVDSLSASYEDPIILITGDHGFWSDGYEAMEPGSLLSRYSIFTALRLPELCRDSVSNTLTPFNLFEVIFACIEGRSPNFKQNRLFWTLNLKLGEWGSPIKVRELNIEEDMAIDR